MSYRITRRRGIGNYMPSVPCLLAQSGIQPGMLPGLSGLGCGCSCGGACNDCRGMNGVRRGLGLFDSGLDWTGWGIGEWATIAFGAWALMSMFGSAKRGARAVGSLAPTKAGKKRRKRRSAALKEAKEAGIL